ncbi:unnamed protein product [Closterium sp. NIES-65]|nr:unnamed protein product [Closterium sp. NIES-65]
MDRSKPVKYGLEIRRKPQSHRPATAAKPLPPVRDAKLETLFGNDDDDDVEADIARQNLKKRSQRETEQQHEAASKAPYNSSHFIPCPLLPPPLLCVQTEQQHEAAMAEDPSVFDYDGVHLKQQAMAEEPSVFDYDGVFDHIRAAKDSVQRQARYIPNLLKTTKEREKEKELVQERLLAKERAKEEEEFAGKERFVTRAYREKLVERQRWLAEEKRKEAEEAANDHNFDFCFNPSSRPAAPFPHFPSSSPAPFPSAPTSLFATSTLHLCFAPLTTLPFPPSPLVPHYPISPIPFFPFPAFSPFPLFPPSSSFRSFPLLPPRLLQVTKRSDLTDLYRNLYRAQDAQAKSPGVRDAQADTGVKPSGRLGKEEGRAGVEEGREKQRAGSKERELPVGEPMGRGKQGAAAAVLSDGRQRMLRGDLPAVDGDGEQEGAVSAGRDREESGGEEGSGGVGRGDVAVRAAAGPGASRGDGLPLRSSQEGAGEDETRQAGGVGREGGSAGGGNGGAGVSGEHSSPGVRKPLEGGDSKSVKVSAEDKVSDARARFLARKKQKSVP